MRRAGEGIGARGRTLGAENVRGRGGSVKGTGVAERWLLVGVHHVSHGDPIGAEEVDAGENHLGAEGVEVGGERGVGQAMGGEEPGMAKDGEGGHEADGEVVDGVVGQAASDDGERESHPAIGGLPGAQAGGQAGDEGKGDPAGDGGREDQEKAQGVQAEQTGAIPVEMAEEGMPRMVEARMKWICAKSLAALGWARVVMVR